MNVEAEESKPHNPTVMGSIHVKKIPEQPAPPSEYPNAPSKEFKSKVI